MAADYNAPRVTDDDSPVGTIPLRPGPDGLDIGSIGQTFFDGPHKVIGFARLRSPASNEYFKTAAEAASEQLLFQ